MNRVFVRNYVFPGRITLNRRKLAFLTVAFLCVALNACMVGGGSGGSVGLRATLSPRALSFPGLAVGTTSAPQTVTFTNAGNATMTISGVTISGEFTQTNTCGSSLDAGASCTFSITFTPTATGAQSGQILITDNAAGSPQAITLEGAAGGTGGGGTETCTGASLPQTQTDVTSQLGYVNTAAGVNVNQITNNGCNRFYYFDVPTYSPSVNKIVYTNFETGIGNSVLWANPDGSGAAVLASGTGNQAFLSGDGTLAYYDKPNLAVTGASDIFGRLLANPSVEFQITNLAVAPTAPLPVWEISSSSPDPAGGQDIAFSPDTLLHMVHVKADGTSVLPLPSPITLEDPESAATFHRLRLNPKFPNIVMYKRNGVAGGTGVGPELWVVDLNTCANNTCPVGNIVDVGAAKGAGNSGLSGHLNWSPDGLDIAFNDSDRADYWLVKNVVNPDGSFNPGFTLLDLGPALGTITADYCVFPPDWPASTILACLAGPASPIYAKYFYLLSTDGTGTTKLLSSSDAPVLGISGTPMPRFAQDDTHILFNSDKTGGVQVYLISGFTLTVP
jgi:hypothetical protein